MARYDGKSFRGAIGNITFRVSNGINLASGKVESIKQTRATISASSDFAARSATAKAIRSGFMPLIRDFYDGKMINRLTSAVINAIGPGRSGTGAKFLSDGNTRLLEGFEFNTNSPFYKSVPAVPDVQFRDDGTIHLSYPAFECSGIRCPHDWSSCFIRIYAIAFDFRSGRSCIMLDTEIEIHQKDKRVEAIEWTVEDFLEEGTLLVTGVSADFVRSNSKQNLILNNKQFNPVSIVSAIRKNNGSRSLVKSNWKSIEGYMYKLFMLKKDTEKRLKKAKR